MSTFPRRIIGGLTLAAILPWGAPAPAFAKSEETPPSLRMIVMDPLALPLSCACVEGTGQRRYEVLAEYLGARLGRKVEIVFEESVGLALRRMQGGGADLIVGKRAMILADARRQKLTVRPLAQLTDTAGSTGLRGSFLVGVDDPAKSLRDLAGKRIVLGPAEDAETHAAARAALRKGGIEEKVTIAVAGSIDAAALALSDGEADAAVVSEFLPALLEGCGKIDRGTTRVLAKTDAVPFVTVYATDAVPAALEEEIVAALLAVAEQEKVLAVMESSRGFVRMPAAGARSTGAGLWLDWRGPDRRGFSDAIPEKLPAKPKRAWTAALTGPAMAGVAVTERFVVVPDKDAEFKRDIFRCLDAGDGREIWTLAYDADAEMDYSNAPRATPVIRDELVYLQGAAGDLHCVELASGKIVWRTNIFKDFGADPLFWGASCAPLVVDDLLVFNPGAKDASLAAVNRRTGELAWKSPGHAAAYSAFVEGTFDGVRQIVGYDVGSLGGWDSATGARLWEMIPPDATDFNVTTPVIVGELLLLATENNGTRLYRFDGSGRLHPEPVAVNGELAPDTCTPVVSGGRVYASAYGEMFCLDLAKNLATVWSEKDDMFYDHTNVIAGNDRVLVWTMSGDLVLLRAGKGGDAYEVISKWRPFGDEKLDSMSHPAIAGDRIYLRSHTALTCIELGE